MKSRSLRWLAIAACTTLAVACGDDGGGSTSSVASTAPATTVAATTATTGASASTAPATTQAGAATTAASATTTPPDTTLAVPAGADTDGTFRYSYRQAVATLDPHKVSQVWTHVWWGPAYDFLIHVNGDGSYSPQLATEWAFSPDGLTFTMKLRDDVTFHDGTPFNAAAVKANIERGKTVEGSRVASFLSSVDSVEAVDDYTVQFNLSKPFSSLVDALADKTGAMISPAAFDSPVDVTPVGTGPFKIVSYEVGQKAVYERWDDYWGRPAGVKRLEISLIKDDAAANALISGQIDMAEIPTTEVEAVEAAGFKTYTAEGPVTEVLMLDVGPGGKFENELVRQAASFAVDRAAFAEFARGIASAQLASMTSPIYDPALDEMYPYDPAKAKEMLAQAGLPNGFSFTVTYTTNAQTAEYAQILQAQMAEAGIDVQLETFDSATVNDKCFVQKDCDAVIGPAQGSFDLAAFAADFFGEGKARNLSATGAVPEVIAAIDAAQAAVDDASRAPLMKALNEAITEHLPILALWKIIPTSGYNADKVLAFDVALPQLFPWYATVYVSG